LDKTAIQIRDVDHVATAVVELRPGEDVVVSGIRSGHVIMARERIPVGHKIALRDIGSDEEILKYGEPIGIATADIRAGQWVHVHNCRGAKARRFDRRKETQA
jgi:altronate dehydratase small subunit